MDKEHLEQFAVLIATEVATAHRQLEDQHNLRAITLGFESPFGVIEVRITR